MTRSHEESQRVVSIATSGALLLLLSLGYLFVPRSDLGDRSPLAVLTSPNNNVYVCEGEVPLAAPWLPNLHRLSETECKKWGTWTKVKMDDGSVRTKCCGWSDVGNLISKDLPSTGGLLILIGASPIIGFLVFQRIRGTNRSLTVQKVVSPIATQHIPEVRKQSSRTSGNFEERFAQIKSLHQKGLITSEEFSNKKKELLEEL